jgi:hypothetical protein
MQFTLIGLSEVQRAEFARVMQMEGIGLTIFGLDPDNTRAFWNWEYLGDLPPLPQTEHMLKATCDLRLPATLAIREIEAIGQLILVALDHVLARAQRSQPAVPRLRNGHQALSHLPQVRARKPIVWPRRP